VQGRGHSGEDEAVPTSLCGKGMGEGTRRGRGRWSEVTAAKPYAVRTMGWLTGGASLSAGAVASEGEGEATDEWGRRVSGSDHARGEGQRWAEGGSRERGRGKAAAGWNRPS
jgi:hypothetical protein